MAFPGLAERVADVRARIDAAVARGGHAQQVAIVAVMRKMITTLNAMVRDDVSWADRLTGRHSVPTAR